MLGLLVILNKHPNQKLLLPNPSNSNKSNYIFILNNGNTYFNIYTTYLQSNDIVLFF